MSTPSSTSVRYLIPVAGPAIDPVRLEPIGRLTIGRHERCELLLPANADGVSRFHARFDYEDGRWRLVDLNSRWGTHLNGVKLTPDRQTPLNDGDLIRISPWTFSFSASAKRRGLQASDDTGQTLVRAVAAPGGSPKDDLLALLLETAAALHAADSEQQLCERLMTAARRGTGLPNAAVLRPLDVEGRYEVIASSFGSNAESTPPSFSRSLLNVAAEGQVAELTGGIGAGAGAQSIIAMGIGTALCVPLLLGGAPAALLYLDARGAQARPLGSGASEFCVALGRIGSLALANLKRIDIERRAASIEFELRAAATAQKWILPKRETKIGPFRITGESRPGQYVGGDFFDVIDLGEGRAAVAIGDVAGKGVAASVLMTATQGYLNASLREHGEPGRAVTAVNQFVCPRKPENRFVTAWVGVFDAANRTLTYVDAGHSYAVFVEIDGRLTALDSGGGFPIGLADDSIYEGETVPLGASGKVMIVSDGIIEQRRAQAEQDADADFKMDGVRACVSAGHGDDVAAVFQAVIDHAGTDQLSDDATAVLVRW